jgi:hypothetical protein
MKIISEKSISDFEAWSGAVDTKNKIVEAYKENDFDSYIEDLYPDGIDETALNDLLWFDGDQILEDLGITEDEEEDEETEDEE